MLQELALSLTGILSVNSFLTQLAETATLFDHQTKIFSLLYVLFKIFKHHYLTQLRQGDPSSLRLLSSFYTTTFGLKAKIDKMYLQKTVFDPNETISFFCDVKMNRWLKLPPEYFGIGAQLFHQFVGDSQSNKYNIDLYQPFSSYLYLIYNLFANDILPKLNSNWTPRLFASYITGPTCAPLVSLTLFQRRVQTMLIVSSSPFCLFVFLVPLLVFPFLKVRFYSSDGMDSAHTHPAVLTQPLT